MSQMYVTRAEDGTTGRYLLVLADGLLGDADASRAAVREVAGVEQVALPDGQAAAPATYFPRFGVAVVAVDDPQALRARAASDSRIVAVEPERVVRIRGCGPLSLDYLRGYRDAATHLYEIAAAAAEQSQQDEGFADTEALTWGLQAVAVPPSRATGAGIRIAVLDTGLDLAHIDLADRAAQTRSFVDGEEVQDGNGHGTHCIGTACGPLAPTGTTRRYGVAHDAELWVGKVLGDEGSGTDAGVLAGMDWAVGGGCQVISMSLGSDVQEVSAVYEAVGRRALDAGCLIIAAAGNNADRENGDPGFVGVPANSPSIMAIGAVDRFLALAPFSAGSNPVDGGQIDLVGPGVDVYSAWPEPLRYRVISGTSMATPHVAGLAALWSQATGATGAALWTELVQAARRLPLPAADVGTGLGQAPQG